MAAITAIILLLILCLSVKVSSYQGSGYYPSNYQNNDCGTKNCEPPINTCTGEACQPGIVTVVHVNCQNPYLCTPRNCNGNKCHPPASTTNSPLTTHSPSTHHIFTTTTGTWEIVTKIKPVTASTTPNPINPDDINNHTNIVNIFNLVNNTNLHNITTNANNTNINNINIASHSFSSSKNSKNETIVHKNCDEKCTTEPEKCDKECPKEPPIIYYVDKPYLVKDPVPVLHPVYIDKPVYIPKRELIPVPVPQPYPVNPPHGCNRWPYFGCRQFEFSECTSCQTTVCQLMCSHHGIGGFNFDSYPANGAIPNSAYGGYRRKRNANLY